MRGNKSRALADLQHGLEPLIGRHHQFDDGFPESHQRLESALLDWIDQRPSIPTEDKEYLKDKIKRIFKANMELVTSLRGTARSYEEIIMTIDPADLEPSPVSGPNRIRRQNPKSGWQPLDPEWFNWSDN